MVTVGSLKIKRANVKLHTYCYRNIYFLKGENLNTQIHSVIYDDYNSVTYICFIRECAAYHKAEHFHCGNMYKKEILSKISWKIIKEFQDVSVPWKRSM